MIRLIPSLSIIGGKSVRLQQGDFSKQIAYGDSPIDITQRFMDHGLKHIHMIDLDGAKSGRIENQETLEMVARHTSAYIDFGGGICTDGDIDRVFEAGAKTATIGSLAARDRELFLSWAVTYGHSKIALSADALDGRIAVRGWQQNTSIDLFELIEYYYENGVQFVKCSDVAKDGALGGPNFELYKELMHRFPGLHIFASGGVSSMDDIKKLQDLGLYGVIFGKAFYANKITLKEIENFVVNRG